MSTPSVMTARSISEDRGSGAPAAPSIARWLSLAAAPTFALMGLWSALPNADPGIPDMPGMSMAGSSAALSGMTLMYLLMSLFHSPPWLKLITRRRNGTLQRAPVALGKLIGRLDDDDVARLNIALALVRGLAD